MQHAWARLTITPLLSSTGFATQALTLGMAADTAAMLPRELTEALWLAAKALPADQVAPSVGIHNQAPIPADQGTLLAQLAPLVLANPGDTGLDLALLALVTDLWPHVTNDERPLLRVRFLNGLMERAAAVGTRTGMPREAVVTSAELKVWNRYLPTVTGDGISPANAHHLLTAGTAQEAYTQFSDLFVGGMDQVAISRILGSVTLQLLNQRSDPHGHLLHPLLGTIAAERLAPLMAPELFTALLSQLAHQVWWAANLAGLELRGETDREITELSQAILSGSTGSIRHLVRSQVRDNQLWWQSLAPVAKALLDGTPAQRERTVAGIWALAARSQGRIIAPDDALAIALLLSDRQPS